MNADESAAHHLVARLKYLLTRLEGEFFHVHPDLDSNGSVTSLALSSILNEAVNLHEACFPSEPFWESIKKWEQTQTWSWEAVRVRLTWWPVLANLQPFSLDSNETLNIGGRGANNSVKHLGALSTLRDAVEACAAAWFLVMERAREWKIYLSPLDVDHVFRVFDCYELVEAQEREFGYIICRPHPTGVSYPLVRGPSEESEARAALERRHSQGK